jgi:hypothetical protein
MKKILLGLFLSASMIACTSKTETKTEIIKDNSKNQELFDRNVASFNKAIDAFVAEDPEVFASFFADSVKWCGPEKKLLTEYSTKAEMVQALKMYFSLYDNHKLDAQFYSGINYSTNKEDLTTFNIPDKGSFATFVKLTIIDIVFRYGKFHSYAFIYLFIYLFIYI